MRLVDRLHSRTRLNAVDRYGPVVAQCRAAIRRLLELAADEFGVATAGLSLVTERFAAFAVTTGSTMAPVPTEHGLCTHTIARNAPTVFGNLLEDPAFADNPVVHGDPPVAFYAGAPVHVDGGHAIGAVCLIDSTPKDEFGEAARKRVADYADVAGAILEQARAAAEPGGKGGSGLGRQLVDLALRRGLLRAQVEENVFTPLHAAIGFARLIHQQAYGTIDNPLYRQYARHITTSIERALRGLERIVARAGDAPPQLNDNDGDLGLDLGETMDGVIAARPACESGRISFMAGPPVKILASRQGVMQGLGEVIDWALAQTREDARLVAGWRKAQGGDLVLLLVRAASDEPPEKAMEKAVAARTPAEADEAAAKLPLAGRLLAREEARLEISTQEKTSGPVLARVTWPSYRLLWPKGGAGETSTPPAGGKEESPSS